jgi:murein DD-endopeptidase MepM/ murein hydrolase activator NlpD
MLKNKKIIYYITLIPLIIFLGFFIWLLTIIFEGEKPDVILDPLPEFISKKQQFSVKISDMKRGLKALKIFYDQGGREATIFEIKFPFEGLLNEQGIRTYQTKFDFDPSQLRLAQGRVNLNIQVWDYSRRGGGDGNMSLIQHKITVDTIPPAIRAISRMHNINMGGTCLVVYRTSSDTIESGVYVDDYLSPGFPANKDSKDRTHIAYFALPFNASDPNIFLWAKDRADNETRSNFYTHIRPKRFGRENINITDSFLQRVLPFFDYYDFDPDESEINKYIKINNESRKADNQILHNLMKNTDPQKLWEGTWIRLKNAATMAKFADHRSYYYKGEKIDEQYHMGVDLASLANSPVAAANNGQIIFAERNGIYGLTVVIDHGQGLASLYGHLSEIKVAPGDVVKKGDIIGNTGQTGLAGGDHLHFSVLVNGVFVNPIEWWDSHWIRDNITRKLELIKKDQ